MQPSIRLVTPGNYAGPILATEPCVSWSVADFVLRQLQRAPHLAEVHFLIEPLRVGRRLGLRLRGHAGAKLREGTTAGHRLSPLPVSPDARRDNECASKRGHPSTFRATVQMRCHMVDWSNCPDVESNPAIVSGAWVVKGSRVPADAVIDNTDDGFTPEEIVTEIYPSLPLSRVRRVIEFAKQHAPHPVG